MHTMTSMNDLHEYNNAHGLSARKPSGLWMLGGWECAWWIYLYYLPRLQGAMECEAPSI